MSDSGTNRRLATILFADVAGYSRMMRADEEQILGDLRAHLARRSVKNIDGPVHIFSLDVSETTDKPGRPAVKRTSLSKNRIVIGAAVLAAVAVAAGGIMVFPIDRSGPGGMASSTSDRRL